MSSFIIFVTDFGLVLCSREALGKYGEAAAVDG